MRVCALILTLGLLLAGCEKYTEKTSPCFGKDGTPIVSRAAQMPLLFATSDPASKPVNKDCTFEPIEGAQQ